MLVLWVYTSCFIPSFTYKKKSRQRHLNHFCNCRIAMFLQIVNIDAQESVSNRRVPGDRRFLQQGPLHLGQDDLVGVAALQKSRQKYPKSSISAHSEYWCPGELLKEESSERQNVSSAEPLLVEVALHSGQDDLLSAVLKKWRQKYPKGSISTNKQWILMPRRVPEAGELLSRASVVAGIPAAGPARGPGWSRWCCCTARGRTGARWSAPPPRSASCPAPPARPQGCGSSPARSSRRSSSPPAPPGCRLGFPGVQGCEQGAASCPCPLPAGFPPFARHGPWWMTGTPSRSPGMLPGQCCQGKEIV